MALGIMDFKSLDEDTVLMKSIPYVQDDRWSLPNTVVTNRFDFKGFDFTVVRPLTVPTKVIIVRSIPILAIIKGIPDDLSVALPVILVSKRGGMSNMMWTWSNPAEAEHHISTGHAFAMHTGGITP